MNLFEHADRYPASPGFKTSGPSEEAARHIKPTAAGMRAEVLAVLRSRGPLTADEVADTLGKSVLSIRPRCSELHCSGKIIKTPLRRRNASGLSATVWRAV